MLYFLVAAMLLLHGAFWGAGLSWLILPRAWRPAWWAFALPLGWALQSAVVWVGAHLPLAGTGAYALVSELIPLALIFWAWRRRRGPIDGRGPAVAAVLIVLASAPLLAPLAQRGAWTLTTSSLGSCDQADYAAGARVLLEFSRQDRVGFLDLPEVTRIGGVERFFDYWLKLNHFSPSAVIAHNAAVFGLEPHQLVSVTAVVLWLSLVPAGFLMARVLGWPSRRRWAAGALLGLTPLGAYAVHHGAMGQVLATHGIVLLTWVLLRGGRAAPVAPGAAFGISVAAFWLIAGSYNFILTIALAPTAAALVARALLDREVRRPLRALGTVGVALAAVMLVFWGRFEGMAERFRLLEQYSFGWPVPLLSPEGWLGMVRDAELHGWPAVGRIVLAVAVTVAAVGVWLGRDRWWRGQALVALAWLVTIAGGWAVLAWESRVRANASYDAFKVITVFLPLLVPVLLGWFAFARGRWFAVAAVGLVAVVAAGAPASLGIARRMADPALRVETSLLALRQVETSRRVASVNLRIEDFWSRLWANALLLRKPQYFPTHTYEARLNTPLRGEWDLRDSVLRSLPVADADVWELNSRFYAVRVGAPGLCAIEFGSGWNAPESSRQLRWRWMNGRQATLVIRRDFPAPLQADLELEWRGIVPQNARLSVNGNPVGRFNVGKRWQKSALTVTLAPGENTLTIEVEAEAVSGGARDQRPLTVALAGLRLRARP
jgi:hypothetical protein